ncbi:hypothetical protein BH20ACT2_BH20ACT2_13030 [soil metagenome]
MKAVTGDLPADEAGWAFEIKWDGMRIMALIGDDELCLRSGTGRDVTARFPELAGLATEVAATHAVLDTEVVVLDDLGRPDFEALQTRMHFDSPAEAARRTASAPVVAMAFDLVHLGGRELTTLAYEDRRHLLDQILDGGPSWQVPAAHHGDGGALLDAVGHQGMEGLVAKRLGSRYEPGRRSPAWRKVKVRRRQELVVGGWSAGLGGRGGSFGALLVGYHESSGDDRRLHYAGKVGTGFNDAELARLLGRLGELAADRCPFDPPPPRPQLAGARWVEPRMVVEVQFGEWTGEGRLRHPSYVGERFDKDPAEVVRES